MCVFFHSEWCKLSWDSVTMLLLPMNLNVVCIVCISYDQVVLILQLQVLLWLGLLKTEKDERLTSSSGTRAFIYHLFVFFWLGSFGAALPLRFARYAAISFSYRFESSCKFKLLDENEVILSKEHPVTYEEKLTSAFSTYGALSSSLGILCHRAPIVLARFSKPDIPPWFMILSLSSLKNIL